MRGGWAERVGGEGGAGQLTELNEKLPIATALVGGQREDAGHVVVLRGLLLLWGGAAPSERAGGYTASWEAPGFGGCQGWGYKDI